MNNVQDLLTTESDAIVASAWEALDRSNQHHYVQAGPELSKARLADLLSLVITSIGTRDLMPIIDHSTHVANERFDAGFDIREVQRAFHVLEEAIWDRIVASTPPTDLAEAIGLVGTVLGAGRDALARGYVSRATHHHVASLDLGALFRGGR
jgi:hypothetical protein